MQGLLSTRAGNQPKRWTTSDGHRYEEGLSLVSAYVDRADVRKV